MGNELCDELKRRSNAEPYGRLLGMEPAEVEEGNAAVRMALTPELENVFGATHGGALFSLIDEAFQLASNSYGTLAVALNVNINYVSAPASGSLLEAKAAEVHKTRRTSSYFCEVRDVGDDRLIATAQALAYRTGKDIEFS